MAKEKDKKGLPKGIYKRGGLYWIRYTGIDGKMVFESAKQGDRSGTKQKDAEDLLHERKADILKGKQPESKRIGNYSFKDLVDQYKPWMEGRHLSAKVKTYVIDSLFDRYNSLPLRQFNTPIVEQLQTELINKGHKNAYVNKVLNILKAMLTKAVEWEMVEPDMLKRVRRVKSLRENKRLRYLSPEECQKLLAVCDELTEKTKHYAHLKPIITMALNTGMRKGEILGLKWSNLDMRNGLILLEQTKNGERREIPINQTVTDMLKALPRRIDGGPVFRSAQGGDLPGDIKHGFATACKNAELTDFHFHDLRHTFASQLVMQGVDLRTVSELLGHKDIKMTMRYAHLAPAHKAKAVDILDKALKANYTKTIQSVG
jgi:integrase